MINNVVLSGRLTKKPELECSKNNKSFVSFVIASQRNFKNKDGEYDADFILCEVWGASAEYLSKYGDKGDTIELVGRIKTESWTNKDGKSEYSTKVVVENISIISSRSTVKQESPKQEMPQPMEQVSYAQYPNQQQPMGQWNQPPMPQQQQPSSQYNQQTISENNLPFL